MEVISRIGEIIKSETEALKYIFAFFGGIGIAINAYYSARRSLAMEKNAEALVKSAEAANKNAEIALKNVEISEDKQITDRFSKAIEQLGSEKAEVKLGAIYTLERIAKDSVKSGKDEDYWTIIEIITAFIRQNCPIKEESNNTEKSDNIEINNIKIDIQAALTVIGRRNRGSEKEKQRLDLESINIRYAKLSEANLSRANLSKADLSKADLYKADLTGANLSSVNLNGADLTEANLSLVNLNGADLTEANLSLVNLNGADLTEANLSKADLSLAKNIYPENIKLAKNWEKAYYDPQINRQLGLPIETISIT